MKKSRVIIPVLFVLIILVFSACKATEPKQNPIIVINEEEIYNGEVRLYLLKVKSEFEELGGEEVWMTEDFSGGKTAEEVAKEGALENLIKVKVLCHKSKEMGIELGESEIEKLTQLAKEYFEGLSSQFIAQQNISQEMVIQTFIEAQVANRVQNTIKENYEPSEKEIQEALSENQDYIALKDIEPEQLLTKITIKEIKVTKSEQGYEMIQNAHKRAMNGENFDDLIQTYSNDLDSTNKGEYTVVGAMMEEELKRALVNLKPREISPIIQTEAGYHIIMLVNRELPTEEELIEYQYHYQEWESQLKDQYREELRNKAFNSIYSEWKNDAQIKVYTDLWNNMEIHS